MRRVPGNTLERELWEARERLLVAQAEGSGIPEADGELRGTLVAYLALGPEGRRAVRHFLFAIDAELADRERERREAVAAVESAERERARYRHHVGQGLKAQGLERLDLEPGLLYFARGRDELVVVDPNRLPDELVRILPAKREPRERELRAALEQGPLAGAFLRPAERVLVVR